MKSDGEIMEILAAYDLTKSLRAAAELTGCSITRWPNMLLPGMRVARSLNRQGGAGSRTTKLIVDPCSSQFW